MLRARKTISISDEPISIEEALQHPYAVEFMQAFGDEIQSLKDMKTFRKYIGDPKEIPKGLLLSSKAIFSIVFNPDGTFKKFKARLVARGDMLKNIFDPDTYAGTAHSETLRLFLSVAATLDLDLNTHDVKTAFLHPSLKPEEKIYLRRPKGATDDQMPPIVELLKCIYGLPQASKYFDEHISERLLKIGFRRCVSDNQLFIMNVDGVYVYLLKHVDDMMVAAPKDSPLLAFVENELGKDYTLTTNRNPDNFLGMAITRDRANRKITLTQPSYIDTLEKRFQIEPNSPKYPMREDFLTSLSDHVDDPTLLAEYQTLFQEKVGSILYLASQTRLDLLYSVTQLARRSNKCTTRDMKAVDRLLNYIFETRALGLSLGSKSGDMNLHAFVDASYACYLDSKSHTGICLALGSDSGAFLALSKKQTITADSTTVAEFVATHTGCQRILWSKNVLSEMGFNPTIFLHEDNTSTIHLLKHSRNSGRIKHIALRYNMIREAIKMNNIQVVYTPSEDMVADIFTKPLGMRLFPIQQCAVLGTRFI